MPFRDGGRPPAEMTAELVHLRADLHVGHIGIEIQPIDTRHVERDMTVEHLVDIHHAGHTTACAHEGGLCPPDTLNPPQRPRRRGPGGGPDLPANGMERKSSLLRGVLHAV